MSDVQKDEYYDRYFGGPTVEVIGHDDPVGEPGDPGVPFDHVEDNNSPRILDSGERREFPSGAVRDIQKGKGRMDLVPFDVISGYYHNYAGDDGHNPQSWVFWHLNHFKKDGQIGHLYDVLRKCKVFPDFETMILEVSKHYEAGAEKYGENNWQKGLDVYSYIDSAARHYLKFLRGDKDEPHDRAFIWNILSAIWTCKNKPELNGYAPTIVRQEFTVSPEAKEKFDKAIEEHMDAVNGHHALFGEL
jgi:hypothetical protein